MMNFDLSNPTRIVFGQGRIADLDRLVPRDARILLLFGGGSIKHNGIYDQVISGLGNRFVLPFGGVEANPQYDTIMAARAALNENGCTFVLGVGGGSVIDAAKFLARIATMTAPDPWDALVAGEKALAPLPNAAVLTLPATGSESNAVSVISRAGYGLKLPFAAERARPVFAILDPDTMKSLSRRQLENGVVDAFTHVIEQYLTLPVSAPVQHGFSETLLQTLIEWGPVLIDAPSDESRAAVMWAANQALNGLIGSGVPQDWSTHMIGHAMTALYGIDHARTLSAVMPALLRFKTSGKLVMLARYGRRVWHIDHADDAVVAAEAIDRTAAFFEKMGCPTRLSHFSEIAIEPDAIVALISKAGQFPLGESQDLGAEEVRSVLLMAR